MGEDNQSNHSDQALEAWKEKREYLNDLAIADVLSALGARANQDGDRNKWKLEGMGNIITKGQMWLNGNLNESGFGSVKLVRHALELPKDTDAMRWIAEQFPEYAQNFLPGRGMGFVKEEIAEAAFTPPPRYNDGIEDIKHYLINMRNIPSALVEREIKEGRLYPTRKWDQKTEEFYDEVQCVFIGPASAEIRSTDPDGFKGCCLGSDSDKSSYQVMFQQPFSRTLAITEAAIDALSHHAMFPHEYVVSTNGAGRFTYHYRLTMEAWRNDFTTKWAFDADEAGDLAAQRMFNALYLRDVLAEEWNTPVEQIDEWFIQGKIMSQPDPSPHCMFLQGVLQNGQEEFAVFEAKKVNVVDPETKRKKVVRVFEPTGTTSQPTIPFKVCKAVAGIKGGTVKSYTIPASKVAEVMAKYNTKCARPTQAKDWNEVWSRQGPQASDGYNKQFGKHVLVKGAEDNKTVAVVAEAKEDGPAPTPRVSRFQRNSV